MERMEMEAKKMNTITAQIPGSPITSRLHFAVCQHAFQTTLTRKPRCSGTGTDRNPSAPVHGPWFLDRCASRASQLYAYSSACSGRGQRLFFMNTGDSIRDTEAGTRREREREREGD